MFTSKVHRFNATLEFEIPKWQGILSISVTGILLSFKACPFSPYLAGDDAGGPPLRTSK